MLPRVQLHVLILLVFSVVAVVALQRMRMPSSLGYLLVGALVGPHAFGLVPDVEHNRVLAEFGIVFLLFTIGLNFSLPQILAMRNLVFGLGTAQVGFTTIVVGVGAWLLGHAPETGFVIGAVVAQSSTTIISKQLIEQGEDQSRHGRLGVAMSVFQDITAVPFVVVIPVQSVSLSAAILNLSEGESQTLTAMVLPANAANKLVWWSVSPAGLATVAGGTVTAVKAGICTVTATAGGKSASCTVNIAQAETAQLIYTLPAETELTSGFDTGLKLLEHASTESPQYTILVDAKAGDNFDASTWPAFLHCLTETGSTANLPGFNSTSSPLNNKTEFAYYNYGGVTLSDSIEHLKTRTRYVVQLDGKKYRGGSTYCPMTEWLTCNGTITDVPQTFLIGAAQSADGSKKQQFWPGTLYQCKVYKGLLSDNRIKAYINKGW